VLTTDDRYDAEEVDRLVAGAYYFRAITSTQWAEYVGARAGVEAVPSALRAPRLMTLLPFVAALVERDRAELAALEERDRAELAALVRDRATATTPVRDEADAAAPVQRDHAAAAPVERDRADAGLVELGAVAV
jgi:hypothetical protein